MIPHGIGRLSLFLIFLTSVWTDSDALLKPGLNILLQPGDCARTKVIVLGKHALIHVAVNRAPAEPGDLLDLSEAKKSAHDSFLAKPVDIDRLMPLPVDKGSHRATSASIASRAWASERAYQDSPQRSGTTSQW